MSADPKMTCRGTKRSGEPCQASPTSDGFCPHHSSRYTAQDRTEWALRGAATTNHKVIAKRLDEARVLVAQADQEAPPVPAIPELQLPDLTDAPAVEQFVTKTIAEVRAGHLAPSLSNAITNLLNVRLKLVELSISKQI